MTNIDFLLRTFFAMVAFVIASCCIEKVINCVIDNWFWNKKQEKEDTENE